MRISRILVFFQKNNFFYNIVLATFISLMIASSNTQANSVKMNLPGLIAIPLKHDPKNLQQFINDPKWQLAPSIEIMRSTQEVECKPAFNTIVRAMWSKKYLYLLYSSPYTVLTTFGPYQGERNRLWKKDVVEVFIGNNDFESHDDNYFYHEFDLAPNNDWVALTVQTKKKTEEVTSEIDWHSQFISSARVNEKDKIWYGLMRIPFAEIEKKPPNNITVWRINLFRFDVANNLHLAWNPSFAKTFHIPKRFGYLYLVRDS